MLVLELVPLVGRLIRHGYGPRLLMTLLPLLGVQGAGQGWRRAMVGVFSYVVVKTSNNIVRN